MKRGITALLALVMTLFAVGAAAATDVLIAGVALTEATPYFASNGTEALAAQPTSGGYAFFDADNNTLELHDFEFESTTEGYLGAVVYLMDRTVIPVVKVYGDNQIVQKHQRSSSDSYGIYGINSDNNGLTIEFDDGAELTVDCRESNSYEANVAVNAYGNMVIKGKGTLYAYAGPAIAWQYTSAGIRGFSYETKTFDLTIEDTTVHAVGGKVSGYTGQAASTPSSAGIWFENKVTIKNAEVTAMGAEVSGPVIKSYGIYAGSTLEAENSEIHAEGGAIPSTNMYYKSYGIYANGSPSFKNCVVTAVGGAVDTDEGCISVGMETNTVSVIDDGVVTAKGDSYGMKNRPTTSNYPDAVIRVSVNKDGTGAAELGASSDVKSYRFLQVGDPAPAAQAHEHCECGERADVCTHGKENITYANALSGTITDEEVLYGTHYYLSDDLTLKAQLEFSNSGTVYLCLNGHDINIEFNNISPIMAAGNLVLCDCAGGGMITHTSGTGRGLTVNQNLTMYGGKITGNAANGIEYDGAVNGGGVFVSGNMTMHGGEITGNRTTSSYNHGGGGVFVNGNMTMTGGEITGNTVYTGHGGGVYASGGITLSGNAKITGNKRYASATADAVDENLYLKNEQMISVNGALDKAAKIGVTHAKQAAGNTTIDFVTIGSNVNVASSDMEAAFVSDRADYVVKTKSGDTKTGQLVKNVYTVATVSDPVSGGVVTGGGSYAKDTNVTLTATANEGYAFIGWDISGVTVTDEEKKNNPLTFVMPAAAVTATAKFDNHVHPFCNDSGCTVATHTQTAYMPLDSSYTGGSLPYNAVYLTEDITLTSSMLLADGKKTYLCLNGHSITANGAFDTIYGTSGHLVLCDHGNKGLITHAAGSKGSGVKQVIPQAVDGLQPTTSGNFTMYGGRISGNTTEYNGGGVFSYGSVTVYGGEISGNTAGNGGGVYAANNFDLYGGEISGNTAEYNGGGVHAEDGHLFVRLHGGTITGNNAGTNGGGLYARQGVDLSGSAKVTGNVKTGGSTPSNIWIGRNEVVWVDSAYTGEFGVTTFVKPTVDASVEYMKIPGTGSLIDDAMLARSSSDEGYAKRVNAAGNAELYIPVNSISVTASPTAGGTVTGGGTYAVGEEATLTATANTGYTFTNWTKNGSVVSADAAYTFTVTEAGEYVANFEAIAYPISYDLSGGSAAGNPAAYTIETETFKLVNPTKANHVFTGWTDGNSSEPKLTVKIEKGSTGALEFTAHWKAVDYAIRYDLAGGAYPEGESNPAGYSYGDAAITLVNPEKAGYEFLGWTSAQITEPMKNVVIGTGSSGDLSFTANWEAIEYPISYDLNGGSADGNPATYTIETETFALVNPTKANHVFTGWTDGNSSEPKLTVKIEKGSTGALEFTAHWKAVDYAIRYDLAGGTYPEGESNPAGYSYGAAEITLVNPEKAGYAFLGWTSAQITEPMKNVVIGTGSAGDLSFTANWEAIAYPISYDLDGGSAAGNPATYTIETETFKLVNPTKDGYTFAGWMGTGLDGAAMEVTIEKGSTGERTYKATWTAEEYTITYHLGGGAYPEGESNPAGYSYGDAAIMLVNPEKAGYEFLGWTSAQITEPMKNVVIGTGSSGDLSFTANWEAIEYPISYILPDGAEHSGNPDSYTVETETFTLAEPVMAGYVFMGWRENGAAPEKLVTIEKGSTGARTFTAEFAAEFTAATMPDMPETGDASVLGAWMALLGAAGIGLGRRKK